MSHQPQRASPSRTMRYIRILWSPRPLVGYIVYVSWYGEGAPLSTPPPHAQHMSFAVKSESS